MKQHDSIMMVVDKLTMETHFILVKTTHKETNIEKIYMKEVSRIHGVPKDFFSNIDPKLLPIFGRVCSNVLGQIQISVQCIT
jgi:hypothetical protein